MVKEKVIFDGAEAGKLVGYSIIIGFGCGIAGTAQGYLDLQTWAGLVISIFGIIMLGRNL